MELVVDHAAFTKPCTKPQISLDQRRGTRESKLRIDSFARHQIHRSVAIRASTDMPVPAGWKIMSQEGQRLRMRRRVRPAKGGTAHHHVDLGAPAIGPDALPEKLDCALGPVSRQHAGTAKFQKTTGRMTRYKFLQFKLAVRIEPICGPLLG